MLSSLISVIPHWILEHDRNSLCSMRQAGNSYHERLKEIRLLKALYKIFSSSSRICTSPSISRVCLMENFDTDFMSCRILRMLMNFLGAHLFTHRKWKFRIVWGFFGKFAEGLRHHTQVFLMSPWEIRKIQAVNFLFYQKGFYSPPWMASTNIFMPHLWTSCPIRKISFPSNWEKCVLYLQFHVLSCDNKTLIWENSVDFNSYNYSAYVVVCLNVLWSPRPFLNRAKLTNKYFNVLFDVLLA